MASPRVFANALGSLAGRSPQSVKRVAAAIMNSPETLAKLPKAMRDKLSSGDPQAIAEVVAYVSGTSAVGVGVVGGIMNAASSPADLSDGLAGAPQDDITPEPVAGESSPPPAEPSPAPSTRDDDLLRQFDAALPTNPRLREQYEALYPPRGTPEGDSARSRYQEHINSLPQNSPEAMARKRKQWAEQDSRMADFDARMQAAMSGGQVLASDTPGGRTMSGLPASRDPSNPRWGGDEDRVRELMAANPGAFLGPGELTEEQEKDKRFMLDNRKSYYDQRYYARTPDGKPVFQPKQKEWRVPYDPSKMPQDTIPGTGNAELGVPAYDKFEYTDAARQMRAGEDTASVMAGGSEMNLSLSEQRQAKQLIRARAVRIARERGEDPAKVAEELMASSRLYRDPATGRLGLDNGDDTFYKNRKRETDDYNLRRERVRQRGLMGLLPSQSALSNNVVEARRILGDPDATDEERLAAKYWLSPETAAIELARAQNPPRGDGAQPNPLLDEQATIMRQQRLNEAAEKGVEAAKGRTRRSTDIDRDSKRRALASRFEEGSAAQLAALAAFDDAWPVPGEAPPSAPGRRSSQQGKDRR